MKLDGGMSATAVIPNWIAITQKASIVMVAKKITEAEDELCPKNEVMNPNKDKAHRPLLDETMFRSEVFLVHADAVSFFYECSCLEDPRCLPCFFPVT